MLKLLYNVFSKVGKQTNFREKNSMSESAKVVNYTEEMVATITAEYEANPVRSTVDSLAERFDKSPRSIIAKLSTLGIYQAPTRVTKTGAPVVKKETLVAEINSKLGVELPSLVKANKQDLEALFAALS
tara:strand:+ start:251 stop:637 length:387 start_codon:yes stop_codon:yes gene_type:complete